MLILAVAFQPNPWMLWEKAASTWAWKLRPVDEKTTRLIIRLSAAIDGPSPRF